MARSTPTLLWIRKLIEPFFPRDLTQDILAVLKRTTMFVFTERAVCLRLPSETYDAVIHRVCVDDLHQDLLAEDDKPFYGHYTKGMTLLPSSFPEQV